VASQTFVRPNGGRVVVGDGAIGVFDRHRQLRPRSREAGGILLGRLVIDSSDVIIDAASEPAPKDMRARFRFFRAAQPAQRAVDAAWAGSGGTRNYLGEWHSHPEDVPTPSGTDLQDWQRIILQTVCEQDFLLFVIVGRVTMKLWELSRQEKLTPVALESS
jgi:integrative and conjugative element protein (TIGR02256 family)